MKYEDFEKFVRKKCMYDTIYEDSDGRPILIIRMLDAYGMVNEAQREWVGLTDDEKHSAVWTGGEFGDGVLWAEKLLKERNT